MKQIVGLDLLNANTGPVTDVIRDPMREFNLDPLFQVIGSMVGESASYDPELVLMVLAQMCGECKARLEQAGVTEPRIQSLIKGGINQGLEEIVDVARSGVVPGVSYKWD